MNIEQIGAMAGQVWGYLAENGESSRAQIKKGLDGIDDFGLAAALGWLAREDKITFLESGRYFTITLK